MLTTGAERNALVRAFVSPKLAADCFKWEQRSLDALAVFYVDKYKYDKRDSETLVHAICDEASQLFGEQILQPAAVKVRTIDDFRFQAMAICLQKVIENLTDAQKPLKAAAADENTIADTSAASETPTKKRKLK